ncbi:hypothetical protein O181_047904 [Austropuccinia psidii MF-1]|uniref:Uncharacterized protein n=1 Tax=Austropuccinia psidii MF-1 TaxID=1389203 RepID=A0A9Q3DRR8_9BASI|nr:hypothetical protein [Austropuccinia psidii MF-1]
MKRRVDGRQVAAQIQNALEAVCLEEGNAWNQTKEASKFLMFQTQGSRNFPHYTTSGQKQSPEVILRTKTGAGASKSPEGLKTAVF